MKLSQDQNVIVYQTGSNLIDGLKCKVVGIANYFGDGVPGNIYILKHVDGRLVEGYECFTLSDACLKKV